MAALDSALLSFLKQQPGIADCHLSKRAEPRLDLRVKTQLDVLCADGLMLCATVLSVSDSGIGFMCREPLQIDERIELRLAADKSSQFEPFKVQHVTPTIGGHKIGAMAC